MPRSSSPGNVRATTSLGSSLTLATSDPASSATTYPTATAATVPSTITPTAFARRTLRAVTVAAAAAVIGVIRGATSIAPITTAAEFASRPKAAIPAERTISIVNRKT